MNREEKIVMITRNSNLTYEELEMLPTSSIDSLYLTHVVKKYDR